ncbi:RND efflux transporter [Pseudomonas aeruginosa]|nr:RND efflux transporter [Pseudomonas aeruginosa]
MKGGFNLSDWALRHQSLVWYLMAVSLVMGVFSYLNLGREEDPSFAIKTMVIQTRWPGATVDDTLEQVTDRIEKKLEELDSLDLREELHATRRIDGLRLPQGHHQGRRHPGYLVPRCARRYPTSRGEFPQGIQGPGFNDEFGDVFGSVYAFTADGLDFRQLRDYVEKVRLDIRSVKDLGKVQMIGAQNEVIYLNFSTRKLAALGLDQRQVVQSLQAQNAVTPSGVVEAGPERISVRTSGNFRSEKDLQAVNLRVNDRFLPAVRPGQHQPRFRRPADLAVPLQGRAGHRPGGGDEGGRQYPRVRRGAQCAHAGDHRRTAGWCRRAPGVEPGPGGEEGGRRFHPGAVRGGGDRPHRQLRQPRPARRAGGGLLDPAGAGDGLRVHGIHRHHHAAGFPRRADHRPRPAGGRCHDHRGDDDHAPRTGRLATRLGDLRLHLDGLPDAHRDPGDGGRLRTHRAQRQLRWRVHLHPCSQ